MGYGIGGSLLNLEKRVDLIQQHAPTKVIRHE